MPPAKFNRQTPRGESVQSSEHRENAVEVEGASLSKAAVDDAASGPFETLIEEIVQSRTAELRDELEALEEQVESVEDFTRISLNDRKIKQNEVSLSDFSESLTSFAEKAFNNINALEDRLDRQALLLAAILDSLEGDVDLSAVHRYEQDRLVTDAGPEEQLTAVIGSGGDARAVEAIDGIGSSYSDRLADAGIDTVADLAAADPEAVAEATGVSTKRASEWIERGDSA